MKKPQNDRKFGFILVLTCFITSTYGSYGDQQPIFTNCVDDCEQSGCAIGQALPLTLRITLWNCLDNCKYSCMQQITDKAIQTGEQIVQFYGKWPFIRMFGLQEPASVVFSILNGWGHWYHWKRIQARIPDQYFLKPFYLGYGLLGVNAWLCSTIFHSRDNSITEKLDYFSAALTILYGLFVAILRITHTTTKRKQVIIGIIHTILFLFHISYLSFYKFDYDYNMKANVTIGMLHNIAWIFLAICSPGHPCRWRPIISALFVTTAMLLELFDFPPLFRVFDAHSLWHAITIPIIFYWYTFLIEDALWDSSHMHPKMR